MNITLDNKVILITGSTSGLGKGLAESFIQDGAKVIINYYNDDDRADKMKDEYEDKQQSIMIIKADVCNEDKVRNLCEKVRAKHGKIDVLINNVGICNDSPVIEMSMKQWNEVLITNLSSAFICSKVVGSIMINQGFGKIINVSSLKGLIGGNLQTNYSTSKAAMVGFTKSLAKEFGAYNISVNAICPGYVETSLNKGNLKKKEEAKKRSVLACNSTLSDYIAFTTLMCSDFINGISGQVFNVDSRIQ